MSLVKEHYESTEAERTHAVTLKNRHGKHVDGMSNFDQGRIHAMIYCVAKCKEKGHTGAAKELNKMLDWMTGYKAKAALSK